MSATKPPLFSDQYLRPPLKKGTSFVLLHGDPQDPKSVTSSSVTWRCVTFGEVVIHTRELSGPVRDTPPYRAIPFADSIAEGCIAPIGLVFIGYRAGIAEIPLLGGGIAPPLHMLSNGETLRQGGRGYRTQLAMLRHQKPHSAQ